MKLPWAPLNHLEKHTCLDSQVYLYTYKPNTASFSRKKKLKLSKGDFLSQESMEGTGELQWPFP